MRNEELTIQVRPKAAGSKFWGTLSKCLWRLARVLTKYMWQGTLPSVVYSASTVPWEVLRTAACPKGSPVRGAVCGSRLRGAAPGCICILTGCATYAAGVNARPTN